MTSRDETPHVAATVEFTAQPDNFSFISNIGASAATVRDARLVVWSGRRMFTIRMDAVLQGGRDGVVVDGPWEEVSFYDQDEAETVRLAAEAAETAAFDATLYDPEVDGDGEEADTSAEYDAPEFSEYDFRYNADRGWTPSAVAAMTGPGPHRRFASPMVIGEMLETSVPNAYGTLSRVVVT